MDPEKQIIKAAKTGDLQAVTDLLTADPQLVTALDRDGSTPLHCAAWKGHALVATLLLDSGADMNAHNENSHWGTTALHAASHGNNKAVVELLIQRGAEVNLRSPLNNLTALGHSRVHNAKPVAKVLLEHGAEE